MIEKLERVAHGESKRLAIFMPPGSAKSTYGSVLFPPWVMASCSSRSLLAASHTTELAEKWGRKVRNLITEHQATLGVELSGDSQSAGRWSLKSGGEYYAAGVGTGIAGFRADGAVIDDPVRNREDADSETIRDKIWEWYKSDLKTRLRPDGWIILIQTRWHEDDLAGRILAEMERGGEQWEVISLPAEAEENDPLGRQPGEFLWDDDYGYARYLRNEKLTQFPRNWSALFQQRPTPDSGDYFKRDWLLPYYEAPARETLTVVGASDYAVTSDGGDFTVHVIVGVDPKKRMYLLDLWRKQSSSKEWIEAWCDLVKKWKPDWWAEEQGQIIAGVGPFLESMANERHAYVAREQFPSRSDKANRAQSIRGRMDLLGLYVPTNQPWYSAFERELLTFPVGVHDDQVDALGLIGQLLDRVIAGRVPHPPGEEFVFKDYSTSKDDYERKSDSFMTI